MRIISGKFKGRRLTAPKHLPVRPTKDMAKEGLFNILNHQVYFPDISVLDLFAGTGNISFEFVSRGVRDVTAVDSHKGCIRFMVKVSTDLEMGLKTMTMDVFHFLGQHHKAHDIIFADPFYDMAPQLFEKLVAEVFANKLLLPQGMLIVEHPKELSLNHLHHFEHERKYGGSVFSFFRQPQKEAGTL
ncbi:RsmD family RNA methyltransferase [Maribacter sp. 2307ULW6-5]|uniref:RsmD family RNA methyltransferase n=1 Tax=Maribacter sp. 2307ULW6-5 TaxID=3386275 RepID=UPI0039BC8FAC